VLGLLVSEGGYPLSYSVFNGKQYEGYTMIPMIDDFRQRYGLGDDFVVVADSGLMNGRNIALLRQAGYKYVIGARIRNEAEDVKGWILSQRLANGEFAELVRKGDERLIIGYSQKRADKDAYNRKRGIARLRKAYSKGTLTKEQVNRRGYNKFLEISRDVTVEINESKIAEDAKWDGLKGYITNTSLEPKQVVEQYHGLWVVERAFRVSKGTLEMRPMFHFTPRRIEAHVCICFVAYKVYKELERLIKENGIHHSVDKVIDIAKTVITVRINMPENGQVFTKTMFLTDRHRSIEPLFNI
jgi:transposase